MITVGKELVGSVLVAGAGISGIQAALDLAESGFYVYLVEQDGAIGGLMSKLDKTFPTNDCAMCVMSPKLVDCGRHMNIEIITYADIIGLSGEPGDYRVKINRRAKSVDEEKCTGCGECVANCPSRFQVQVRNEEERKYHAALSSDQRDFVEALLHDETDSSGNLLGILQKINEQYRYLPEPVLKYIADATDIPLARIVSVATFYNAFSLEPRGEHIISVCTGTACFVKGAGVLFDRLQAILDIGDGGTTKDGKFTLQSVRCIGCCALAPAVRIGEETFGKVKLNALEKILGRF